MSYTVSRMYFSDDYPTETIKRGLTLEEAQAHCRDPETSSSTATRPEHKLLTKERGSWFDGYKEETQ